MDKQNIYGILFIIHVTLYILMWIYFAIAFYFATTISERWFFVTTVFLIFIIINQWYIENYNKKLE